MNFTDMTTPGLSVYPSRACFAVAAASEESNMTCAIFTFWPWAFGSGASATAADKKPRYLVDIELVDPKLRGLISLTTGTWMTLQGRLPRVVNWSIAVDVTASL